MVWQQAVSITKIGADRDGSTQEMEMDQALRTAYTKTALHRMGIPFERAIKLDAVRIPLEGSVRRSNPQPATKPAQAAAGR